MTLTTLEGVDAVRRAVGTELGPTEWMRVTQDRVDAFAEVSGDHQWIHVDIDRARQESQYGGTIAHGYLTLSLCNLFLPQMLKVTDTAMGINYGANKVRFPSPVLVGSRIRGRGEIIACDDVAGGIQVTIRIVVDVEGQDKPGCVVETLNRWIAKEDT